MRAYRALLHLFPASFRGEYGGEMSRLFAVRLRDTDGIVAHTVLWASALLDVTSNAARVHADLLRQDLRYTRRSLGRAKGFALTAILVTGLGVGATTATFSIADHVLLRPLPFADAGHLVRLWQDQSQRGYPQMELSPANYRDFKQLSTSFESLGAFRRSSANLVGEGDPLRLEVGALTAEVLPMLGVPASRGRVFNDGDVAPGGPPTVLLGDGLWRSRFGGDPGVVGRPVLLDGVPHTVIGVMPARFHFPSREIEAWTALRFEPADFEDRSNTYLYGIGRLRGGLALEQARAELRVVASQVERANPKENADTSAGLYPLSDVSDRSRVLLLALVGAALCVLLIACSNLAHILLARAAFRRRELAVRAALGAGRERLVRQLLTESLALAVLGGMLGLLLAVAAMPVATRLVPTTLPIAEVPAIDLRVLSLAGVLTLLTGVGFGVLPALRMGGQAPLSGLREGSRGGGGTVGPRTRSLIVGVEVAVTVVLLVSAGLLIRSLWRVQSIDPGFRAEGVLTLRTSLPLPQYEVVARREQFYSAVLQDVRALPGVTGAAYASFLPMAMRGGIWPAVLAGEPAEGGSRMSSLRFVTPGFFQALSIPLRRGRDVAAEDTREALPVAVVSESFARACWPGEDPLGRRFTIAFQERTVVGVVGDVRVRGLERESEPQVYLPSPQVADGAILFYAPRDLVLRGSGDLAALVPALRRIVAAADPQQPISNVRTLAEIVAAETATRSVQVRVLGTFAAMAALLAAIGIHGLLAFTVSARAREIGVRLALGATPRSILGLVLGQGMAMAGAGVAIGAVLAYVAARALTAVLVGVHPWDGVTFSAAVFLALLMTAVGSLLPALRAVRVDPLDVLRAE